VNVFRLGTQVAVNLKQYVLALLMACRHKHCLNAFRALTANILAIHRWLGEPVRWAAVDDLVTREEVERVYLKAQASMCRLNKTGAQLMHKYGAHAATDVTGFGILGHANNLASNQVAAVSLHIHTLPVLRGMAGVDARLKMFKLPEGFSAETSGQSMFGYDMFRNCFT